ncbi:MAG: energy transducer TonB [bacterium]|nr:MAG: energy transducer TonB [bacterium]
MPAAAQGHELSDGSPVRAEVVAFPEPVYPLLSRKRGEEGRVVLEVTVSAEGSVHRARIRTSSSHPLLDQAALEAVKAATFSPAVRHGQPVESMARVAYRFRLKDGQ